MTEDRAPDTAPHAASNARRSSEPLEAVDGVELAPMTRREREDGQAVADVLFEPLPKRRCGPAVVLDHEAEPVPGFFVVRGVEDGADRGRRRFAC
jgi:hypothetical protein